MCTSPLIRFRCKDGSYSGVSASFIIKSLKEVQSQYSSYSEFRHSFDEHFEYYLLPCRKCDECKMKYATDWAIRCAHEFHVRKKGCFITLTIDDLLVNNFNSEKNLKRYCKRCVKGNRYISYPINYTLCKGLLLDFLKRLRDNLYKRYNISIRYFGCGEYGCENERPHYHILIFGYDFPDHVQVDVSKKGVPIYHSDELHSFWDFGMVTVQELNTRACFYTAKYCLKKLTFSNDQDFIENYYGREPEFLVMSRGNCNSKRCPHIDEIIKNCKGLNSLRNLSNPYCKNCYYTRGGLGFDWLSEYGSDLLKIGYVQLDGVKYDIPKYYKSILELTNSDRYVNYKIKKYISMDEKHEKHFDDMDIDRLNVRKKILKDKIKKCQNRC